MIERAREMQVDAEELLQALQIRQRPGTRQRIGVVFGRFDGRLGSRRVGPMGRGAGVVETGAVVAEGRDSSWFAPVLVRRA